MRDLERRLTALEGSAGAVDHHTIWLRFSDASSCNGFTRFGGQQSWTKRPSEPFEEFRGRIRSEVQNEPGVVVLMEA